MSSSDVKAVSDDFSVCSIKTANVYSNFQSYFNPQNGVNILGSRITPFGSYFNSLI